MPIPNLQTTATQIAVTNWSETEETAVTFPDEPSKTQIKVASTESKEGYAATTKTDPTVTVQPTLPIEDQSQQESETKTDQPETEPTKEKIVTLTVPETARPESSNTPICETKSIYDYEFDVSSIKRELVSIGLEMGLEEDDSLTPCSSSWANPVTVSEDF